MDDFLSIKSNKFYPVISYVNQIIQDHAVGILNGKPEFIHSQEFLDIYWPPGEFAMLKLIDKNLVNNFYIEAENLLIKLIDDSRLNIFIKDCIKFNRETLKKPMINKDKNISLNYNIPILYQKSLIGKPIKLSKQKVNYRILSSNQMQQDFLEWAKKVIWYGHRKANYLYDVKIIN